MEFWYIIITYLNAWRFGYGIQQPRTSSYDFHIATKAQNKLGWKKFSLINYMYLGQCVLISIINQFKKEFQELHSFQDWLYKYVKYLKHNGMIGTDAYTQFKKHQNTKTAKTWQPRYLMNIMKATIIYQIIIFILYLTYWWYSQGPNILSKRLAKFHQTARDYALNQSEPITWQEHFSQNIRQNRRQ